MKKILFLFIAALCITSVFASPKKKKKVKAVAEAVVAPKMDVAPPATEQQADAKVVPLAFKEVKHTFGKIKQGTPVTYEFSFKNATAAPVVIESATAQCGCTTPEYPKAPIAKGVSDKIKVTYNAASPGSFTKQVTVRVAKTQDPIILTIEGEVVPNAAPAAEEKKD